MNDIKPTGLGKINRVVSSLPVWFPPNDSEPIWLIEMTWELGLHLQVRLIEMTWS